MAADSPNSDPQTPAKPASTRPASSRRVWWFRLGAVLFGLFLLIFVEAVCWVFDWGRVSHAEDPFVGFRAINPLFELDDTGETYAIPPARYNFFAPESFPAEKGKNTFRIFCVGESTTQGRPWSKETSFTTFLELGLKEADDSRDWEVINCGGVSYASYRLVSILEECLEYEPDLIILAVGHNEFLEDRTYGDIKHAPEVLAVPQRFFGSLRTFTLFRQAVTRATGPAAEKVPEHRPELPAESEPILDYNDGLKVYHRDPEWRAGVILHYESNLNRMVAMAEEAGVPMLLILEPSNLGDCAPFKSEHKTGMSGAEERKFDRLIAEAKEHYRSDLEGAMARLKSAVSLDDQYAGAWYELGQCYRTKGLAVQAREAFVRARDEDICPLRMITPLEEAFRRVAEETDTPWLDAHALLEQDCRQKILDGKWLIDHVHPTIPGYQKIADALVEKLAEEGIARLQSGWQARAHQVYEQHVEDLGDFYFLKGERTLEAVRGWTKGQAKGPPAKERFSKPAARE
jgi:lysophospholipase L1-like esterase